MCCKQTQMTDALLEEEAELCVLQTDSDDRRSLRRKLNSVCCKQTQMTDALLEEEAELCVLQTDSDDRRAP